MKKIKSPIIPFLLGAPGGYKGDEQINSNTGFTLVELLVTITILTILGVIGFMSFQNYTVYSRDVVRLTHISNIKSVLEYNNTETGLYPKPDGENNITYSQSEFELGAVFEGDMIK